MSEERDQFEAWFADHSGQTIEWVKSQRETDKHYKIGPEIQRFWMAWQASRSAQSASPALKLPDEDYFSRLVAAARERAEKAMRKFPQPNYVLNKVAEESGEVIKAVIHYTEGREDWLSVEGELIDNLAMLIRLVKEGDQVIGFNPPDEVKRMNGVKS